MSLRPYRCTLIETECEEPIFFDCEAEDSEHAREQAENAYPGCTFVEIIELTRIA